MLPTQSSPSTRWELDVYQFNGWFALSDSAEESEVEVLAAGICTLRQVLAGLTHSLALSEIMALNGDYFLFIAGAGNRPRDTPAHLDHVLEAIGRALPGSYGLLYERDDESADATLTNAFRVRVMTRGSVTEGSDPFLSPINPTIED